MAVEVTVAAQAAELLALVREGRATTRPEISTMTGWGRTQVNQRLGLLLDAGLVNDDELAVAAGRGRVPRALRLVSSRGQVVSVSLGNTTVQVGVHDLSGRLLDVRDESLGSRSGPQEVLPRVRAAIDALVQERPDVPLWGIGIGLPSPVEFHLGRFTSTPWGMPLWQTTDFSDALRDFDVPIWLENDVNVMALGEVRQSDPPDRRSDLVYLKIGTWLGAGLVGSGNLYRGWLGCAGEVAHVIVDPDSDAVCFCGKRGCVSALGSGQAVARQATEAAANGQSELLKILLEDKGTLTGNDVVAASRQGDRASIEILGQAGRRIGRVAVYLVSILNPRALVLGGGVGASDIILSRVQEVVYAESFSLATRDLRITHSRLGRRGGLYGAASLALDELFKPETFSRWIAEGSPAKMPELGTLNTDGASR